MLISKTHEVFLKKHTLKIHSNHTNIHVGHMGFLYVIFLPFLSPFTIYYTLAKDDDVGDVGKKK